LAQSRRLEEPRVVSFAVCETIIDCDSSNIGIWERRLFVSRFDRHREARRSCLFSERSALFASTCTLVDIPRLRAYAVSAGAELRLTFIKHVPKNLALWIP
jgi:hypothetical protein